MASEDRQDSGRHRLSAGPLQAPDCPACGGPNGCAVAAAGCFDVACWCSAVRIAPERLAGLSPEQRGVACLCRHCAGTAPRRP
ncbi:helicase [Methylibium sp. Pch-M]|uniref:cysteine-rich CWC family protein n=1 Tax=Methylibium sp. Pch-M TaxID=2082386 RepID=UPI00101132E6|nr:cysteine-rich CWC family protein [Methylibium sp. Pch-M]QAZ38172.1 helicase [Methylibium sp. Pch-M]